MADFEIAVNKTIENEGGDKYTETPGDRGGATKYGISLMFLKKLYKKTLPIEASEIKCLNKVEQFMKDDIKNLTIDDAKLIYKVFFWDANRYCEIEDQVIANKVFDMSVLIGPRSSNKILQKCINMKNHNLKVDGIIGDKTLESLSDIDNEYLELWLLHFYTVHFMSICNNDKSQSKFLLGWLNRVMS